MITEIIPNLYIGTIWDAIHDPTKWALIINVNEWGTLTNDEWQSLLVQDRPMLHVPFMEYGDGYPDKPGTEWANPVKLFLLTDVIDAAMDKCHVPILVHCAQGVERSPLAVMFFLTYSKRFKFTIEEAYEFVKEKRPIVQRRLSWIKKDYED